MNTDQKMCVANICCKFGCGTFQMAVPYQSLKQKSILAYSTLQHLQENLDETSLKHFETVVKEKLKSQ